MYQINSEIISPFPYIPATRRRSLVPEKLQLLDSVVVSDSHYTVKVARESRQITELLRLRYQVFNVELGNAPEDSFGVEEDEFDATSHHLIVVENETNKIIGGYRLRTAEMMNFYSSQEFQLGDLPENVLHQSVEIGRACIASEHRHGKVLFLLWKGLVKYLQKTNKRYFFGCCSLFSRDFRDGIRAFNQLEKGGFLHKEFRIAALKPFDKQVICKYELTKEVELPKLFNTYLRIGAKVCSPPVIDSEFGTIDFFVLCDSQKINKKYRKMFFA